MEVCLAYSKGIRRKSSVLLRNGVEEEPERLHRRRNGFKMILHKYGGIIPTGSNVRVKKQRDKDHSILRKYKGAYR
jgi:hypothetical protein